LVLQDLIEIFFSGYCLTLGEGTELVGTLAHDFVHESNAAARDGIAALSSHSEAQREIFTLLVYLYKSILSETNVLLLAFSTQVHLFPAL